MSANSTIQDGSVVAIRYTLTSPEGELIDSSGDEALEYLHGADNIVPGLENALGGAKVGDELEVVVSPEEGYGPREDVELQAVPRDNFPEDAEILPGTQFLVEDDEGQVSPVWVAAVEEGQVLLDLQHPLAGVSLNFQVSVVSLRAGTEEELEHGHPHGPGGHHH